MDNLRDHGDTSSARAGKGKGEKGKRNTGGEASKRAKERHEDVRLDAQAKKNVAEGHDRKKGNIGPSGQGPHRGRERNNRQSNASGRPNVSGTAH